MTAVVVVAGVVDLLVQTMLVVLGLLLVLGEESEQAVVALLVAWCLLATAYWAMAAVAIAIAVRRPPPSVRTYSWLERTRFARLVSTLATFVASLVGAVAATELLTLRRIEEWSGVIEWVAVWAMLLSWALFHWGFARIYDRRYRLAPADEPPLVFPGTPSPRLADFVYFSFTNGTAFSVSDVSVTTTRMRFTVVWHTTLSFFFNALIIVLAVNTIIA
ncbi:DUF1345 domain-containing protein [Microbacterium sp.]|uniref:DUF1345 domain-containing protein n=1 Tax=Microbacterium sp. TaxID=51671 RepID=UPI0039E3797C